MREFYAYAWESENWVCHFCRARWNVRYPTWHEVNSGQVGGPGVIQIAEHLGQQEEAWVNGDEGMCTVCDVVWETTEN